MLSKNDFAAKQIIFLVTKEGEKLLFRNDNILVVDKNGTVIHQSTCYRLFAVFVVGHTSLTTGLIQRAKKFGFAIVLMTTSFRPYQIISSFAQANVLLRKKQYMYNDIYAGITLAKNKISNQRQLIVQIRNKNEQQKDAIKILDEYLLKIDNCHNIQSIMGIEGSASKIYFKNYFDNVLWNGRKPRIKFDMINSLLDIGYTILFSYIDAVIGIFGFDSYNGILHRQFYMRKSLVCDLVEPFRVIIDKRIKKGINLKQFKECDFEIIDGKWQLKYNKSAEYSAIFLEAIMEHREAIFGYIKEVYQCFMKDKLNAHFPVWRYE